MKKVINVICTILSMAFLMGLAVPCAADGPVDITSEFKDPAFREIILEIIGKKKDDRIFSSDISGYTHLDVHSKDVTDLSGIEYFESLMELDVANCTLTSLDVNSLKNLTHLTCYGNKIKELDIHGLQSLEGISCYRNDITDLRLSDLPSVIWIDCSENELTSLDLSGVPSLEILYCNRNKLETLDLTVCPKFRIISCDYNNFDGPEDIKGYQEWMSEGAIMYPDKGDQSDLYKDVKDSDWFYNNIDFVNKNGIMNGVGNGLFAPNTTLTRAMAVTIIYRLDDSYFKNSGDKKSFDPMNFTDVPEGTWFTDPVKWANKFGIVLGRSAEIFDPNGAITRAEFASMLYRFFIFKSVLLIEGADSSETPSDFERVPEYAKEAVLRLFSAKVINGRPGGIFDSNALITRAEAAAMIDRFTEKVSELNPDDYLYPVASDELLDQIKKDFISYMGIPEEYADTLYIQNYYGNYNGSIPVMFEGGGLTHHDAVVNEIIAGYSFRYSNGNTIMVWKDGTFYSIKEAYDRGLLTANQVGAISIIKANGVYISFSNKTV